MDCWLRLRADQTVSKALDWSVDPSFHCIIFKIVWFLANCNPSGPDFQNVLDQSYRARTGPLGPKMGWNATKCMLNFDYCLDITSEFFLHRKLSLKFKILQFLTTRTGWPGGDRSAHSNTTSTSPIGFATVW